MKFMPESKRGSDNTIPALQENQQLEAEQQQLELEQEHRRQELEQERQLQDRLAEIQETNGEVGRPVI